MDKYVKGFVLKRIARSGFCTNDRPGPTLAYWEFHLCELFWKQIWANWNMASWLQIVHIAGFVVQFRISLAKKTHFFLQRLEKVVSCYCPFALLLRTFTTSFLWKFDLTKRVILSSSMSFLILEPSSSSSFSF